MCGRSCARAGSGWRYGSALSGRTASHSTLRLPAPPPTLRPSAIRSPGSSPTASFRASIGACVVDDALARITPEAVDEFLLGEAAFARDAWLTAERHYLRAYQLDSSFVLAGWRLGNARRWMPLRTDPPYPPGLFELLQDQGDAVPALDRQLIEAQFQRSGAPRFEQYEKAMLVAGNDAYAPLLYGDELFHRGPLVGRSQGEAVRMLERAVASDSTLAPAWEHLAWALIRDRRAGASQRGLGAARAVGGRPGGVRDPCPHLHSNGVCHPLR